MYISRLTDKYSGLHSSVPGIFFSFGIEKYSSVIFLDTEEYNKIEEDAMFSCSDRKSNWGNGSLELLVEEFSITIF
jgi:hypothetical protein